MSDQSDHNPHLPPPTDHFKEDTISFFDIMLILARQIRIIIITPTIFCTLAIIYVLFYTEPYYTSTAKIMSSSGGGGVSQAAGLAAQFGISLPTGQSEPNWVYPEIIKSRTLARAMLKRNFSTEEYGLQKSLLQILTFGNDEPKFSMDTLEILAIEGFIKKIIISEDRKTGIYTLTISASEPQLASDIIAALIEELDTHQKEYNKAITSKARKFIEERIVAVGKELREAEESLKDFTVSNRRIENSPLLLLEQQRLAREVSIPAGVFTMLKQQLETTKIEEVKESDYVVVLDPPEAPLKRSGPNRRKMVIFAGFLGIGLGMVIGLVIEFLKENQVKVKQFINLISKNLFKKK
jgi:uncharacterized protein involved in exopolysaccharide biosynthesis